MWEPEAAPSLIFPQRSGRHPRQFDFDDRGPAIVEPAMPVYSVQGTESRVSVPLEAETITPT